MGVGKWENSKQKKKVLGEGGGRERVKKPTFFFLSKFLFPIPVSKSNFLRSLYRTDF